MFLAWWRLESGIPGILSIAWGSFQMFWVFCQLFPTTHCWRHTTKCTVWGCLWDFRNMLKRGKCALACAFFGVRFFSAFSSFKSCYMSSCQKVLRPKIQAALFSEERSWLPSKRWSRCSPLQNKNCFFWNWHFFFRLLFRAGVAETATFARLQLGLWELFYMAVSTALPTTAGYKLLELSRILSSSHSTFLFLLLINHFYSFKVSEFRFPLYSISTCPAFLVLVSLLCVTLLDTTDHVLSLSRGIATGEWDGTTAEQSSKLTGR